MSTSNTKEDDHHHRRRVAHVKTQMASRGTAKIAMSAQGRVGHCVRRNSWKNNCWLIDVSALTQMLSIDTNSRSLSCVVEPGITFERLCQETLKYNLLPLVIPEFKNITVGGAIQGIGVESSSFKHGLFEDSVLSVDVVNGQGDVLHATAIESADLFYGMFGSYGSMGVMVCCSIQLMKAAPVVQVSYRSIFAKDITKEMGSKSWWTLDDGHPQNTNTTTHSFRRRNRNRNRNSSEAFDFCEALVYSKTHAVVVTARFEDSQTAPNVASCWMHDPSHWRFWWGRWFYQHAQMHSNPNNHTNQEWTEAVPTIDYLFRHDRGIFWCAQVRGVGTSLCERVLHGWFWSSSNAYKAEHQSNVNNDFHRIVQDIAIPVSKRRVERFLTMVDSTLGVYPLWLCPIRNLCLSSKKIFSLPVKGEVEEWYVNVGILVHPLLGMGVLFIYPTLQHTVHSKILHDVYVEERVYILLPTTRKTNFRRSTMLLLPIQYVKNIMLLNVSMCLPNALKKFVEM